MDNTFDQDFCPACGTILPLPDGSSMLQCLLCRKIQDISGLIIGDSIEIYRFDFL